MKNGTCYVTLMWILFGHVLVKIGLLFAPTSGHTCMSVYFGLLAKHKPENIHCKGKYHCTDDLLFDCFVFDQRRREVA